jgi:hypothetical protein
MYQVVMFLLYSTRKALHQNIARIMDLNPIQFPNVSKQAVSKARQGIMGRTPPWAEGLMLVADGYETAFYMKK